MCSFDYNHSRECEMVSHYFDLPFLGDPQHLSVFLLAMWTFFTELSVQLLCTYLIGFICLFIVGL